MIREFSGGESWSFLVDPKTHHFTNVVKSYAQKSSENSTGTSQPDRLGIRGAIKKQLQRLFLPEGYPSSVTDDLLPTAKMELLQQVCGSIPGALSTRAVLMGIGVGAATANASSSTISWVMRDGVRLIASVFFAAHVSTNLDERSKTWRMVADVCGDFSALVEVFGSWCPPLFLWMLGFAACLKAVVGVCAMGSRTSFAEHFAKIGNMADVTTKANNRDYVASFLGLFLGSATMYCTPQDSVFITMSVFLLFTFFHLFANYYCLRSYIMDYLNGPRLEVCIEVFKKSMEADTNRRDARAALEHDKDAAALDKLALGADVTVETGKGEQEGDDEQESDMDNDEDSGDLRPGSSPSKPDASVRYPRNRSNYKTASRVDMLSRGSTCTMKYANNAEYLFILPPPPLERVSFRDHVEHMLSCILPTLKLRIRLGVSMKQIFPEHEGKMSLVNPDIVHKVEESLSCRGVALLYHSKKETYYVIYPEYFTSHGQPASWEPFRRQAALLQLARQGLTDPEEAFQEKEQGNHVLISKGHGSLMLKQLWAFFYAYYHNATVQKQKEGKIKSAIISDKHQEVFVIQSLSADGVLDAQAQQSFPFEFDERSHLDLLEELFQKDYGPDGLYPAFILFFTSLKRQGYRLDRLLLPNEGWTVAVHYL